MSVTLLFLSNEVKHLCAHLLWFSLSLMEVGWPEWSHSCHTQLKEAKSRRELRPDPKPSPELGLQQQEMNHKAESVKECLCINHWNLVNRTLQSCARPPAQRNLTSNSLPALLSPPPVSVLHTLRSLSDLCLLDYSFHFPIEIFHWKIHLYASWLQANACFET